MLFKYAIKEYPLFFIFWNIFLAWLPFVLAHAFHKNIKKNNGQVSVLSFVLASLWLLFLPNAAYIISDGRHLNGFCQDTILDTCVGNSWLIFFFFSFASIGWVAFYFSVEQARLITKSLYPKIAEYLHFILIPLISLGLLMGLVDRLNSWDLFVKPLNVLVIALSYFQDNERFFDYAVTTASLFFLYYFGRLFFKAFSDSLFKRYLD